MRVFYRCTSQSGLLLPAAHAVRLPVVYEWDGDMHAHWLPLRLAVYQREVAKSMQPKVGRNDPCPCGSGAKFKKCCGAAADLH